MNHSIVDIGRNRGLAQACMLAGLLACAACDGGSAAPAPGGVIVNPPGPTPSPSSSPSPSPSPGPFVGAVYAGTNYVGSNNGFDFDGNYIAAFGRDAAGVLSVIEYYETGGSGSGGYRDANAPPRLNPLVSEDSIISVDDRYLLVVNAGTNNVSSLRINADFSLTRIDVEPSGGTLPISLAYRDGVVFVANADEDGVFTAPPNQSGNIVSLRLDTATGQLTPIAGGSTSLRGRPADLEVSPDGKHLLVSSLNASSPQLPQPTAAEISSFAIQAGGTLSATPTGTGQSTPLGNPEGRNLPNAIGIETLAIGGRQFVVAAESRTVSSTGVPAATFATLQTGSLSSWEIDASGALLPRSQDFLLGPSAASGPTQAGFLAFSPLDPIFWVASSAGAKISGLGLTDDGRIVDGGTGASGVPVDPTAANPLANADGYVDMAVSPDGRWLYQLVGLRGRIDVYEIDTLVALNISLRQQVTAPLLPMSNLQGLVAVGRPR